jgi:carbonic anhydrase/acetyltransferase-like protein (isoleucine patch superfamily)
VLSGAIGRRAVLGSRALFRSGIALPAGALIVARPEEAIGKFDERSLAKAAMRIGDRARDV